MSADHPFHAPAAPLVKPWAQRMADSVMQRDALLADRWRYEIGVTLLGIWRVAERTGDARYRQYVKDNMDAFVQPDGSIRTYNLEDYNLDLINQGRLLFPLYRQEGDERYRLAAMRLRQQLRQQPRTSEGGFWHKLIYPHQMWLDGIYMAGPFLAEYAGMYDEPAAFDEVINEILLMEKHSRDPLSGLLYHGWDESRQQRWASPITGCSPHFWGRAVGWFGMALVDVIELLPKEHPGRAEVWAVLKRLAPAVLKVQDDASGVWYQILDQPQRPGNYREASASCMFAYMLAKGARLGCLDAACRKAAEKAYAGILNEFIEVDSAGLVNLNRICSVGGLGGNPYRDGSYEYYLSEKIVTNDHKGMGAFLLASLEIEEGN
ncbi:MAG TPA: glycoside hydrolase family 88 protein [Anaerolineaceae bacterium]